ncbi:hypothetical protein EUTSA_v10009469mg [Eutrema salsugineum]|uniref:Uncharacterized protein n=1 Tax=Eutrema salsugineum TaxID=72664 RepID=V4KZC8_EUTSA|nr:hypothetical protein EUTSA_v10009469mg [Eutrema salsugineum]
MVSCVLILLVLHHVKAKEGEAASGTTGVCELANEFPGKCGNDGINVCINDMQKKHQKENLRCECFDHPTVIFGWKKRICKCRYNC